jgi:hypothetical protein
MDEDMRLAKLAELRAPFEDWEVQQLPGTSRRPPIDYVSHADVTRRLLDVDPYWTWEPLWYEENGRPGLERDAHGNPVGLWIKLTVCGVTRIGYGSIESPESGDEDLDAVKKLISDAIKNASMRFGVALDLWSPASRNLRENVKRMVAGLAHQQAEELRAWWAEAGLGALAHLDSEGLLAVRAKVRELRRSVRDKEAS